MLVLGLVCDITLLGVLQGRVHVAECGELLLDAGDLDFCLGNAVCGTNSIVLLEVGWAHCGRPKKFFSALCVYCPVADVLSQTKDSGKAHGTPLDRQEHDIFG